MISCNNQISLFNCKRVLKFIYHFLKDTDLTNLTITKQTIFPENSSVYLEWLTPIDPYTKDKANVTHYRVQWGPIRTGAVEKIIWREGQENTNQVNCVKILISKVQKIILDTREALCILHKRPFQSNANCRVADSPCFIVNKLEHVWGAVQ